MHIVLPKIIQEVLYFYTIMRILLAFLVLLLGVSCGSPPAQFNGFEQFEGTWNSEQGGKWFSETWKIKGERMYGQGYLVEGKDTLFGEKLVVELVNGQLVYMAFVEGQDPVMFTRQGQGKSFRFENREHDFPQVIVYEPQLDDQTVYIMLEGKQNDSIVSEKMFLKKQQP